MEGMVLQSICRSISFNQMGQSVKRIIPTMIPAFYSNSKIPLQGKRKAAPRASRVHGVVEDFCIISPYCQSLEGFEYQFMP